MKGGDMNMKDQELKASDIPDWYALCFNGECGKKLTCMHHQAMLQKLGERTHGHAIYPTAWQKGACPYYHEKKRVQKAWGFSQLYKNVEKHYKAEARRAVSALFGRGNGQYYRAHHGEIMLTPKQQAGIMSILAKYGRTNNIKFDHYKTVWDFDECPPEREG